MVGADAEKGGIEKNGANLVTAVACGNVPKFTVGNYGMWWVLCSLHQCLYLCVQ